MRSTDFFRFKHKEPEALSRISQYIHAKFKENTTEPYKTQVQKKINTTISPDNTPLNPNNRSRSNTFFKN